MGFLAMVAVRAADSATVYTPSSDLKTRVKFWEPD